MQKRQHCLFCIIFGDCYNRNYVSREVSYNQYDEEEFSNVEEAQQETLSWKKEQYMDASGAWRKPGMTILMKAELGEGQESNMLIILGGWRN